MGAPSFETAPHTGRIRTIVWAVWAVMLASDAWLVAQYASPIYYQDDFGIVHALTGHMSRPLLWLWSQHNEHRLVLPRMVLLGLTWLAHGDIRAGMYFSVLALGLAAALLIQAAVRLRGRPAYTDLFFPFVLLHWGHCENLLWGWQVGITLCAALEAAALAVLVYRPEPPSGRRALVLGLVLVLLVLCGAAGVAIGLPVALWQVACGLMPASLGHRRLLTLLAGAAPLTLIAAYLVGYHRPLYHPPSGLRGTLVGGLEFLSTAFGPPDIAKWPRYAAVSLACGLGAMAVALVAARDEGERVRALGLVTLVVGLLGMAATIGWGRAALGPGAALARRYTTFACLVPCAAYFGFLLYGKGWSRILQTALACFAAWVLVGNTSQGHIDARIRAGNLWYVEHDIREGVSVPALAARYSHSSFPIFPLESELAGYLRMLRDAGIEPYRHIPPDLAPAKP